MFLERVDKSALVEMILPQPRLKPKSVLLRSLVIDLRALSCLLPDLIFVHPAAEPPFGVLCCLKMMARQPKARLSQTLHRHVPNLKTLWTLVLASSQFE